MRLKSLETRAEAVGWKLPDANSTRNYTDILPHQVLLKYLLIHPQGQDSLTSTRSRDSVWRDVRSHTCKAPTKLQCEDKCEHGCTVQTKGDAGDKTS
jgi:hypothetical protein